MTTLPEVASDSEIVAIVDQWAALLEREDYVTALTLVRSYGNAGWTPDLIREAILRHGERVTLEGTRGTRSHEKEVTRWQTKPDGTCGDVWYDLYVDGQGSDLTATFYLRLADGGLTVELVDIGVK